ncbi:glycine cleavage system protein GcvH [Streptacidiphilus sp. P02-A3a]|uniref:glycine cleavage system protein GcvH n=1 Tax=Streptacidiphilus sp. P02-A3a TaxID=2704468 RepID=UPI0015FDA4F5|nr:glycine cleavage system protein GcvH [Streptacidiphilus sp. P02-A3a]QMU70491.1 glycine cleavage system protein GcvH [Streptacidiphilus sp. P02-A3a]
MAYPTDHRYTREHEWILPTGGGRARVGLTDFAQKQLGDIVFVELPTVGDKFEAGDPFGTVESVKAVTEVYAPVGGSVVAVNEELNDAPEEINNDANLTWLVEFQMSDPEQLDTLLSAAQYEAYLAQEQ